MHQTVVGVVQEGERLQKLVHKEPDYVKTGEELYFLLEDVLQRNWRGNFRYDVELLDVAETHSAEVQDVRMTQGSVRPNELQPAQGSRELLHGDVLMRSEVVPHQQRVPRPFRLI